MQSGHSQTIIKCESCLFPVPVEEIKIHHKGDIAFHFCKFCSETFLSNVVMYPNTKFEVEHVMKILAKSHNILSKKIEELNEKIDSLCRKS